MRRGGGCQELARPNEGPAEPNQGGDSCRSGRGGRGRWTISPEGEAGAKIWTTCMSGVSRHFLSRARW